MKRNHVLASLALAALLTSTPISGFAQQQSETASTDIYDFSKFDEKLLLDLFVTAQENGRKYPTVAELKAAGIYEELQFVRSHVAKRKLIDNADRLIPSTYAERELFLNLPMAVGKGIGGYPSKSFASDNFSFWNYTNLWGSWNHSLFQAPGAWADAAHKNGTDILSGMKFFDSKSGNPRAWIALLSQKKSDQTYKYAQPLINLLRYLGMDGINYNWEAMGYNNGDVVNFHRELYAIAQKEGFDNFHIMIYTVNSTLGGWDAPALFGFNGKRTAELMLNYSGSGFTYNMRQSVMMAESVMKTSKGLYAGGWLVGMDKNWSHLSNDEVTKRCGIALWGEHDQSRFWSYNSGKGPHDLMSNYQMLLERAFSGGYRNPAKRPAVADQGNNLRWSGSTPPLSTFAGLATWIPERSAIGGNLPFATYFNLGNGERYCYKGRKTGGAWYNMANQDIVPTYRWLVYEGGSTNVSTAVQPEFTNTDAYMGGSCLMLTGKQAAAQTDVVLYKTDIQGTKGNIYANVAIKNGKGTEQASNLYLLVRVKGNPAWKEFAVGDVATKQWEEKRIPLTGINSGDVIDRIGLRVKNSDANYKMYVGKLLLADDFKAEPKPVEDFTVQVKEETKKSLSVKAAWTIAGEDGQRVLTNADANIDHFELLYKNGEKGKVSEIARTTQWATFVGDIELPNAGDAPFVGVRAVSTDLKTYSPVVWQPITRAKQELLPDLPEEDYGTVELDMAADGAATAQRVRHLTVVKTEGGLQNIEYTANKPVGGKNYVDATHLVWRVKQGQTVTIKFKGYEATEYADNTKDDLRYCLGKGWLDLNGDHVFNGDLLEDNPDAGECLFNVGKYKSSTIYNVQSLQEKTFTIPNDARVGKSRLRIVFSDAWFEGALQPVGKFNKGFAIDLGVMIEGTNTSRSDKSGNWDEGQADQPEGLDITNSITNAAAEVSTLQVDGRSMTFAHVEQAWIFAVDGTLVTTLHKPSSFDASVLPKGVYLVKMKNKNVVRVEKITMK